MKLKFCPMACTVHIPDADFTPNPARAISVKGRLDETLLESLRPKILELTDRSRDPITLYIDSAGGSREVGEEILKLLRRTTPDDPRVSRIITVAWPKAASAAANLLSAGDWAIAFPESRLLYHGARWPLKELTGEWARIARGLPTLHEIAASSLARTCYRRFLFVVSAYRSLFPEHRADKGNPDLTDLECFQAILREKLSPAGQTIVDLAIPLWHDYNGLFVQFRKRLRRGRAVTRAYLQKLMLNASVAFEYENHKDEVAWDGGLGRISEHFYFLNAYFDVDQLCDWIAGREEIETPDAEPTDLLQFRLFFVALCRALQEGENQILPMDAVFLGLLDTVQADITSS